MSTEPDAVPKSTSAPTDNADETKPRGYSPDRSGPYSWSEREKDRPSRERALLRQTAKRNGTPARRIVNGNSA